MKQLLQNLANGTTTVADVPCPQVGRGRLLIRTTTSLVSAGTERMLVDFGKANWLDKARQQPDKVRLVLDKARTDGVAATLDAVRSKLDQPLAPGYCNVGVVREIGAGVDGFTLGDRVASNGKHAEWVAVPKHLCARIPDAVTDEQAAFTVLGVTGLELSRADFYEKELSFQVSCSYGPGRYDPLYEEQGQDYPIGHVRWTEQRNFEAVLDLLAAGRLDVEPLISHRFAIDDAEQAYALLAGGEPSLGILLGYAGASSRSLSPSPGTPAALTPLPRGERGTKAADDGAQRATLGFIGAGNYAGRVLIPAFARTDATLHTLVTRNGVSAVHYGKKYGFRQAATDAEALLADEAIDTVVIATRHDSHAPYGLAALRAGKHVFVEKPLCLTLADLEEIETENLKLKTENVLLTVGFNRRFAPQVRKIKALLDAVVQPKAFSMTVNAGAIPAAHWTQNPETGGGRIIGEACHFVDLLRFLAGAPIVEHRAVFLDSATRDSVAITLRFADGSIGTVQYLANGHKAVPKERLEVFCAGRVLRLDNFRKLAGHGWPGFRRLNRWRQDKGQRACAAAFVEAVRNGGPAPIPVEELIEVGRVMIEMTESV